MNLWRIAPSLGEADLQGRSGVARELSPACEEAALACGSKLPQRESPVASYGRPFALRAPRERGQTQIASHRLHDAFQRPGGRRLISAFPSGLVARQQRIMLGLHRQMEKPRHAFPAASQILPAGRPCTAQQRSEENSLKLCDV